MNRAYSLLTVKLADDNSRTIVGMATTPAPDRLGDIVEPDGAQFSLPMPLLWHHDGMAPIGHVTAAKVGKDGIEIEATLARVVEPGRLKDRLDEAWQSIKAGLVKGLSIGFKPLDSERIEGTFSYRFKTWAWLELSAVTIAANEQASIARIKSLDAESRGASAQQRGGVVRLNPPGVAGPTQLKVSKGADMATVSEQIAALEAKRAANTARMEAIMAKGISEGRSSEPAERDEFDVVDGENDTIDADLLRLKKLEKGLIATAKAVARPIEVPGQLAATPGVSVKVPAPLAPGLPFVRMVKVKMAARLAGEPSLTMAQRMYGPESEVAAMIQKAAVVAGTTISGNWAATLVSEEGAAAAQFLEWLRPATILGKFGQGGIPPLNGIDFYAPAITQTSGGAAYWVGEGKAKPLTAFSFERTTLTPLKIANIAVLTEESIRYSSPKSDEIVRRELGRALIEGMDLAFIDPANAGTANVKPASITNGAESIASTGDTADAAIMDVRALMNKFVEANNAPTQGVWIMSATNAMALGMMRNALGQAEFPAISLTGGTFFQFPVIVSDHVFDNVVLVAANQIWEADEGGIQVDMSREASLEMSDAPTQDSGTGGGASMVSMFQTNSVALRAERTINWKRARESAVAYLTSVSWGGIVPES